MVKVMKRVHDTKQHYLTKEIEFYGEIIDNERGRHFAFQGRYKNFSSTTTTSEGLAGLITNSLNELLDRNSCKALVLVKLVGNFSAYDYKRIKSLFEMYGRAEDVEVSFEDDVAEYKFQRRF